MSPRSRPGTTREAAALAGLSVDAFNKAMQRERAKGRDYRYPEDQWYSGKAPTWDLTAVEGWVSTRKRAEKKREAGQ